MYLDTNGLPMVKQADGTLDGGDSLANASRALMGGMIQFLDPVQTCVIDVGLLIRNPTDKNWWWLKQLSRDQLRPFVWAISPYNPELSQKIGKNYSFLFFFNKINSDFMTKLIYLRLMGAWYTKWFTNYLMDFGILINIIIDCLRNNPDDVGDTLNLTVDVRGSLNNNPTWILKLAIRFWAHFKPKNNGNIIMNEIHPVVGAWTWYYRPSTGNNFEIAQAWEQWIEENIK